MTLHKSYGCYPCQFSFSHFHILLSPSPPSMANSKPTTINTQWPQNGEKKSQPKENPTINYTHKRKNFQSLISPPTTQTHLHHSPSFKPQLQTQKIQTHQHKIFISVIQNCQPKPTNTENPNPNPGILRSKTKIMKMRSEFLFLGIYLCVDEHGEWV